MNATDTERGWVAATLSTSGTFSKNTVRRILATGEEREYTYPRIEYYSNEEWMVDRLMSFTGYGNKSFRTENENYGIWKWAVTRQEEVRDLAIEILPLMPEEKREKVLGVL